MCIRDSPGSGLLTRCGRNLCPTCKISCPPANSGMIMKSDALSPEDTGFAARARMAYDPYIVRPRTLPEHLCIPLEQAPGNFNEWEASEDHAVAPAVDWKPGRPRRSWRCQLAEATASFAQALVAA